MTLTDGLEVFGGIITTIGILALAAYLTAPIVGATGSPWGLAIPFLVQATVGTVAWRKRRDNPGPFLNGLIIGACICMLVCCICDASVFNWSGGLR
jgi:hypothetical protein